MVSPSQFHAPDTCGALAYSSPAEKELPRDLLNPQCVSNTEPTQIKGGRGGGGWGSNLDLLQKLLVLQEQHPQSTENKWYLDLHINITESPSALITIQLLPAPAAIRSRRDKCSGDRYCLYLLILAESVAVLSSIGASSLCTHTGIN